jgi:crotonobetainyl-CoA:carnitine CoA-transferase CaiB-like acyl-CoA transferase
MAVLSGEDLMDDTHLAAVDFWQFAEDTQLGRQRLPGISMQFSTTPGSIRRLPPKLGEHSVQVLGEAGYARTEIDALLAEGISVDGA